MWYILKAELSYVRYARIVLVIPASVVLTFLIYREINVINLTMYMSSLIISANIIGIKSKENRSHREVLLPVRRNILAFARSLLIILPSIVFLLLGIILQLSYTGYILTWYDSIYELMMMTGVLIFLGNLYLYLSDIYSITERSSKIILNSVLFALLLFAMVIIALSIKNIFNNSFSLGILSILLLFIAGLLMSSATIKSYKNREILTT